MKKSVEHLRTWIEIKERAVKNNYEAWRKLIGPKTKLMGVVKSNAYGHGLIDFSKQLVKLGVDWLGVDSIVEAVALRQAGIKKNILVLGYTRPDNFASASEQGITLTISTLENWRACQGLALPKTLRVHLKVDTGMHRQGFLMGDFEKLLAPPLRSGQVKIEGIYSHLAAASSPRLASSVGGQSQEFEKFLTKLDEAGIKRDTLVKHLVATGGAIGYPEAHYDLVRVGLGLYGYWPSEEWRKRFGQKIKLQPVLTWQTIIGEVKTLTDGGAVGYDLTESSAPGTRLAVCPIGYWHGFPRALSGLGEAVVRGRQAKVIGRVSMDMIVIDVTKIKGIKVGDVVTLIGKNMPVERLAELAHTSVYEIITRLNPLIQKFYR